MRFDLSNQVLNIDLREYKGGPVHMVMTDPPWDDEHLPLYGDIARLAADLLYPGCFLLACCGNLALPAVEGYFRKAGLKRFWILCGYQGNSDSIVRSHKVMVKWRPVVAYTKGPPRDYEYFPDGIRTTRRKNWHEWEQDFAPVARWITSFTKPGEIVLDPCVGGGAFLEAAKRVGRQYIGLDIDPVAVENARHRLELCNPLPLEVEAWQESLIGTDT
jgi:hypothetical protein